MTTSLKQQLQQLAVPQTTTLLDTKTKASIIFDRKEAATKTRSVIYELGLSGLKELIIINPDFQQFRITLFDETAINLERSVETTDVNNLLDKNIKKFLHHLSPFFLLRPSQLCLEWLIRRFHIHEYNRSDLLGLILPYHETNIFVRVLQAIRLRESDKQWGWLRPLQKPGLTLPKGTILNRAATNEDFLKFICTSTMNAITELRSKANSLQVQMNFYASIVVGALDSTRKIQEWHITTILPSVLQGISSQTVDFVAASYIVFGQLLRTQLTAKLCNRLIEKIVDVRFAILRLPAVLLLIAIFDSQDSNPQFSEKSFQKLIQQKWFIDILSTLVDDKVLIHSICIPLMQEAIKKISTGHVDKVLCARFLNNLIENVKFSNSSAQELIRCFLDCFAKRKSGNKTSAKFDDVIEIQSDDEMDTNNFQQWYSEYLKKIERHYPVAFEQTLKEELKRNFNQNSVRNEALKIALSYRLRAFDSHTSDIYESLYHHTSELRLQAVKALMENLQNFRSNPQNYQLLKECIADRILDDDTDIVNEVLKLNTTDFVDILGYDKFVKILFEILYKIGDKDFYNSPVILRIVMHLVSEQVLNNYDVNLILLALMPILFPSKSSLLIKECIVVILKSELSTKMKFLQDLEIDIANKSFKSNDFRKQFLDVATDSNETPSIIEIFKSLSQHDKIFTNSISFSHFLMVVTAFIKTGLTSTECLNIFNEISNYCNIFKIKTLHEQVLEQHEYVPLQLFSDFLITMTSKTKFANLTHWENFSDDLQCFFNIFEFISVGAFGRDQEDKLEWTIMLKDFFDVLFKQPQDKIVFLTNFYIYDDMKNVKNYTILRIKAIKIFSAILKNMKNNLLLISQIVMQISIGLCSQNDIIRQLTLNTLNDIQLARQDSMESHVKEFLNNILSRQNEISLDYEQYPLILYVVLQGNEKKKKVGVKKMLREIVELVVNDAALENPTLVHNVLNCLKHFNDKTMFIQLLPTAIKVLEYYCPNKYGVKLLPEPFKDIYLLMCHRFNADIIEDVLNATPQTWTFVQKIFENHSIFIPMQMKHEPLVCSLLANFDQTVYENMPSNYKIKIMKLIVETVAAANNDHIHLSVNKFLKKCSLDCEPFVSILENMYLKPKKDTAEKQLSGKREGRSYDSKLLVGGRTWKEGLVLLEILESKRKLSGTIHLIPALFEILKTCLELEKQSSVEYTKQLILSTLLHCCQKAKKRGESIETTIPQSTFRIDQIVQCMRTSHNPQTHSYALMLLSHCASLFPQQVLHNIVDIFTFVGSSVMRHDDAYSFHIIDKIIESIIPILVNPQQTTITNIETTDLRGNLSHSVIPVLKVFSDIILDVPEHRRLPLYIKLMETLDCEKYLWAFLCVLFDSEVINSEKPREGEKKRNRGYMKYDDKTSKRAKIAMLLVNSFSPQNIIETAANLVDYVQSLPLEKDAATGGRITNINDSTSTEITEYTLFDIRARNAKQLRHYRYMIMQLLSTITQSSEFLENINSVSDEDHISLKPYLQKFIIRILTYAQTINTAIEKYTDTMQLKYWKVIQLHLHDLLESCICLLSADMFLAVVHGLLTHKLINVRRKVTELLINKLKDNDSYFDSCDPEKFRNILEPLTDIVTATEYNEENSKNDQVYLQQTALIAIKLISKRFAVTFIEVFKSILAELIKMGKRRSNISKTLLATIILTISEIASNLKVHSLAYLSKFMPVLISILQEQCAIIASNSLDNTTNPIITSIQTIFESMPLFLGPYILDVITLFSIISNNIRTSFNGKDPRIAQLQNKISITFDKIATCIPLRVLIPNCEKAFKKLMENENYKHIGELMKFLPIAIQNASATELSNVQTDLTAFFFQTLEFRTEVMRDKEEIVENLNDIELLIINAFVSWVLKLSESSFRPMYNRLYEWALKGSKRNERILTYFLLTNKIAEALKALFVLFANEFINDIPELLYKSNTFKESELNGSEELHADLVKAILSTLHNIFLFDNQKFMSQHRFKVLHQPIVDQLENRLVLENEELQEVLLNCISQLGKATSNDILWKQLNYQVLLKARTNLPELRILSFNCCIAIARKLGEEFRSLLPETIPFIAELLEDDNAAVEKNTCKGVQELEIIVNESLQKYF